MNTWFGAILACVAAAAMACVAHAASPEAAALYARYAQLEPQMAASAFARPLVVDSSDTGGRMQGEIHGELAHPFAPLAQRLTHPAAWCDVIVLHYNVKGCAAEGDFMTVYSGRKVYEPLDRAFPLRYRFHVAAQRADYLRVELAADNGPLGTRDYELVLEAMPIGERTFVSLRYAFRPSAGSRFATATYLATAGSGKAGFTVVGRRADGSPEWIGGVRGIVERNAMRNFLALDAWLDTCDAPLAERAMKRLLRMAALTAQYPAQLVEMPADEYVAIKQREWRENRA
jgi:hypothetical protein